MMDIIEKLLDDTEFEMVEDRKRAAFFLFSMRARSMRVISL